MSSFPVHICLLRSLQQLVLSGNRLTVLTSDVGTFHNMVTLNLSNNSLHSLPVEMKNLNKLKVPLD